MVNFMLCEFYLKKKKKKLRRMGRHLQAISVAVISAAWPPLRAVAVVADAEVEGLGSELQITGVPR